MSEKLTEFLRNLHLYLACMEDFRDWLEKNVERFAQTPDKDEWDNGYERACNDILMEFCNTFPKQT